MSPKIRLEPIVKQVMVASFILFLIFMIPNLGKILFLVILVCISILAGLYRKILPFYLGIETLTFTAVIACYLIHPIVAWIACLIVLSAQAIMTGHITMHYFVKIGVYTCVVIFCALMPGVDIGTMGKAMAIFVNIAYFSVNLLIRDVQGLMDTPGNIINIFLNFWLFNRSAGILSMMM